MAGQGWKDTASGGQGTLPELGTGEHCQAGGCCRGVRDGGPSQTGGQCQELMERVGHCEMGTLRDGDTASGLRMGGTAKLRDTSSLGDCKQDRDEGTQPALGTLPVGQDWGVTARLGDTIRQ